MKWSDLPLQPSPKMLRQFAAAWLVFLLGASALQYWGKGRPHPALVLAVLAVGIGVTGLVRPRWVRWVFVGAMVLAFPVGWVVSLVMLLVMYYLVLTPVAVVLRWRRRDLLHRRPAPEQASFWSPKEAPSDVRSYFRQY